MLVQFRNDPGKGFFKNVLFQISQQTEAGLCFHGEQNRVVNAVVDSEAAILIGYLLVCPLSRVPRVSSHAPSLKTASGWCSNTSVPLEGTRVYSKHLLVRAGPKAKVRMMRLW